MSCKEIEKLNEQLQLHREANLFLGCGGITYKFLMRDCRAQQASLGRAIWNHRSQCRICSVPHS